MIDCDVATKLLGTELLPQRNIADLISGITFAVLFSRQKEINTHTHTHTHTHTQNVSIYLDGTLINNVYREPTINSPHNNKPLKVLSSKRQKTSSKVNILMKKNL